jgi:hypothetical protein
MSVEDNPYEAAKARHAAREKAEADRLQAIADYKASVPFTKEMATAIVDLIADGDTIREIAKRDHLPTAKLIRRWQKDVPEFARAMTDAERTRLLSWEDEMIAAARDTSRDRIQRDSDVGFVAVPDSAAVSRSKLTVETLARRLRAEWPQKYGDSLAISQKPLDLDATLAATPIERLEEIAQNAELEHVLRAHHALAAENAERAAKGKPIKRLVATIEEVSDARRR